VKILVNNPRHFGLGITICIAMLYSCNTNRHPHVQYPYVQWEEVTEVAFAIDTAFVTGDTLRAIVSYSGGCAKHEFTLEKSGFMMKSLPPKQPLRIVHRSEGDPCRALIREELSFDLNSYRGTPDGVTVLILENWNLHINYSYRYE